MLDLGDVTVSDTHSSTLQLIRSVRSCLCRSILAFYDAEFIAALKGFIVQALGVTGNTDNLLVITDNTFSK